MATTVIDRLEVIDVEEQQRQRLAVALRAGDFPLHSIFKMTPVPYAGKRIGRRQFLQFGVGTVQRLVGGGDGITRLLQLVLVLLSDADIPRDSDKLQETALLVIDPRRGDFNPD